MQIVPTPVGSARWSPSGTVLAFDQTVQGLSDGSSTLATITPMDAVTPVDVSNGLFDQWPQWSRDGTTIYYSKISAGATSAIWHVTPSGTSDDSVSIQNPSFDVYPSPSPDGSELAYIADLSSTSDLRILTLSTGAVTPLHIVAWSPVWAPTGETIAYLNQFSTSGQIAVVNADGSGQRVLSGATYNANFDWSPDGQYIVAQNAVTQRLDLITVATGATFPLTYSAGYYAPSWKPTGGGSPQRVPRAAAPRVRGIGRRR